MTKVGWYPDPDDDNARRYWDGEEWSAPLSKLATGATPVKAPHRTDDADPGTLFDPFAPIGEDNQIPDDCDWAKFPYPGVPTYPDKKMARRPIPELFVAIGTIRGRPLREIQAFVGLPQSWTTMGHVRHASWHRIDIHRGSYHYTLGFDRYDICTGIVHQINH